MTKTILTPASKLQINDIVWSNGMRIQLLTKTEHPSRDGLLPAYSHVGQILNVEEVNAAGLVPKSWRVETRPQFIGTPSYSELPDRWDIQSNDLMEWAVETE